MHYDDAKGRRKTRFIFMIFSVLIMVLVIDFPDLGRYVVFVPRVPEAKAWQSPAKSPGGVRRRTRRRTRRRVALGTRYRTVPTGCRRVGAYYNCDGYRLRAQNEGTTVVYVVVE